MTQYLRSLATAALLFFSGALFIAATSSPATQCNMTLKIMENGDHVWQCYGSCPAEGETCSLLELPVSDGTIMMCWCPQSSTTAQCPGSLWVGNDGTVVPRCLLDDMTCHIGGTYRCVTELSYNDQFYRPVCKCTP